jgi:hypothetical protein
MDPDHRHIRKQSSTRSMNHICFSLQSTPPNNHSRTISAKRQLFFNWVLNGFCFSIYWNLFFGRLWKNFWCLLTSWNLIDWKLISDWHNSLFDQYDTSFCGCLGNLKIAVSLVKIWVRSSAWAFFLSYFFLFILSNFQNDLKIIIFFWKNPNNHCWNFTKNQQ